MAALKLDMNKAYNRVSWLFILEILTTYGFPPHWVQMVQQCLSTVSHMILISGVATPVLTPQ